MTSPTEQQSLTHLDEQGRLKMVDVGGKEPTARLARVRGEIRMDRATARLIAEVRSCSLVASTIFADIRSPTMMAESSISG